MAQVFQILLVAEQKNGDEPTTVSVGGASVVVQRSHLVLFLVVAMETEKSLLRLLEGAPIRNGINNYTSIAVLGSRRCNTGVFLNKRINIGFVFIQVILIIQSLLDLCSDIYRLIRNVNNFHFGAGSVQRKYLPVRYICAKNGFNIAASAQQMQITMEQYLRAICTRQCISLSGSARSELHM